MKSVFTESVCIFSLSLALTHTTSRWKQLFRLSTKTFPLFFGGKINREAICSSDEMRTVSASITNRVLKKKMRKNRVKAIKRQGAQGRRSQTTTLFLMGFDGCEGTTIRRKWSSGVTMASASSQIWQNTRFFEISIYKFFARQ